MKKGNDKLYYCSKCPKKFTKISAVYRHVNNNHLYQNGSPCLSCGKKIKKIFILVRNIVNNMRILKLPLNYDSDNYIKYRINKRESKYEILYIIKAY